MYSTIQRNQICQLKNKPQTQVICHICHQSTSTPAASYPGVEDASEFYSIRKVSVVSPDKRLKIPQSILKTYWRHKSTKVVHLVRSSLYNGDLLCSIHILHYHSKMKSVVRLSQEAQGRGKRMMKLHIQYSTTQYFMFSLCLKRSISMQCFMLQSPSPINFMVNCTVQWNYIVVRFIPVH